MSEIQNYTLAIEATPEYTIEIDSNSSPEYTLNLEAQPNYTIETGSNVGGFWGALNGDIQNQEDLITLVDTGLFTKVDKIEGKGLSANDLTDELKEDYDQAVSDSHTHTNKDLLDDITNSGDGDLFLADDGTYKEPVIKIGTSSTASATAEKAVVCSGFELVTGATIQITFSKANTHATPTININSTGAKSIKTLQGDALKYIPANIPLDFRYDGTNLIGLYTNTFAVMPDYSNPVSKAWNTIHQSISDGYLYVYSNISDGYNAYLEYSFNSGLSSPIAVWEVWMNTPDRSMGSTGFVPIPKGMYYKARGGYAGQILKFYSAKGAS